MSDDSKDGQEKTGLGKTCLLVCIQTPVVICLHTIEHRLAPTTGSAAAAGGRKRPLTPVEESVQRAKEAVMLDLADPQSWCEWVLGFQVWGDGTVASTTDRSLIIFANTPDILGNAYVALFFSFSHAPSDLERALGAYQKAVSAPAMGLFSSHVFRLRLDLHPTLSPLRNRRRTAGRPTRTSSSTSRRSAAVQFFHTYGSSIPSTHTHPLHPHSPSNPKVRSYREEFNLAAAALQRAADLDPGLPVAAHQR